MNQQVTSGLLLLTGILFLITGAAFYFEIKRVYWARRQKAAIKAKLEAAWWMGTVSAIGTDHDNYACCPKGADEVGTVWRCEHGVYYGVLSCKDYSGLFVEWWVLTKIPDEEPPVRP